MAASAACRPWCCACRASFPRLDDDPRISAAYDVANAQVNELLYRRVDLEDVVSAHLLAIDKAPALGFARYIVSATTPFSRDDAAALREDAAAAARRLFPDCQGLYAARGWRLFPTIDRVYDSRAAVAELGWRPQYDFRRALDNLAAGRDFRSPLAQTVGAKGYHGG